MGALLVHRAVRARAWQETVDILRHLFPQYKYPGVSMDNAAGDVVVKAASFFQPGSER
jgi:hypothetical protein